MIIQTTRKRFPFVKVPKSSSRKEWQVQAINATPSGVQWSGRVIVMAHMGRPGLSAAQKADLRQRWKQGAVIERDRPGPRQARRLDSWRAVRERRIHSSRSHAVALGTDTGGARRDFAWPGHGALDPADRGHARSRTVDRQPGNPPPWWSPRLSRRGGRHASLGTHATPQVLSARHLPSASADCREQIGVGVVASTSRGMTQTGIPRSRHHAGLS